MTKDIEVQEQFYRQLTTSKIPPIIARYLAMRLQELKVKKIVSSTAKNENQFIITTDINKYLVSLPSLPIPDAKIKVLTT